jgi:phenylacetic acid degradation operon negative regulatory protein
MARELAYSGSLPHATPASSKVSSTVLDVDNAGMDSWSEEIAQNERPARLLLMLLGDYFWGCTEYLPSSALVAMLSEFGISDGAARSALARLVHRDLLVPLKRGRQTFYGLSDRTAHVFNDAAHRIYLFGKRMDAWDGLWSLVAFSIPENNRKLRYILRDRLRWLGFAPFYDGLWISPRNCLDEAASCLSELSISTVTLFRAYIGEGTSDAGLPQRAWNLESFSDQYHKFIADMQIIQERIQRGCFSRSEALIVRTQMLGIWRDFLTLDPDLPDEFLPPDWPRAQAQTLFSAIYDELGPLAQQHIQQIIARFAPNLASIAAYHRFACFGNDE